VDQRARVRRRGRIEAGGGGEGGGGVRSEVVGRLEAECVSRGGRLFSWIFGAECGRWT